MRGLTQGRFTPKNKSKYKGDPTKIFYRSSWELHAMLFFDSQSNIISWSSEETIVPYLDKASGRYRRYYPDFIITFKHEDGSIKTAMIEIKPSSQVVAPRNKKRKGYLNEVLLFATNSSKWEAAKLYCEKRGWEFRLMTEHDIRIEKKKINKKYND